MTERLTRATLGTLPARRRLEERVARALLLVASSLAIVVLVWLIGRTAAIGLPLINWNFLTATQSRFPAKAGIGPALLGSLWLGGLVLVMAVPVGIMAGIYLNEYARQNRFTSFLRTTIANLAGVPSIVFGILGLALFVRTFGLNQRGAGILIAGALTLAVMSLPIIIVATEEALKAVPQAMREAAYGLGATKWQVTKDHVLPYAVPGILTGTILAVARAMGETAPLILVGGATAIFTYPSSPLDVYTALPLQTYNWAAKPQAAFRELAAAGTLVLLAFILTLNLGAILLRSRYQKKLKW